MFEDFKNILDNENECNDFRWISRYIEFTESYKQDRPKISPTELKLLVYNSNYVNDTVKKICEKEKCKYDKDKIYSILSEIGFSYDLSVIRWLGFILVKILRRSLSGLLVNESSLMKIKDEMKSCPIVFVPTHRSYADFILMAFVCFKYNISIPCVAAGMDFLSMKFMNKVLRKCKAFFLRRKFADDPIYRTVFKEYVKALISYENSPIEFFIEGTRSRTGKSLMPKFGFLTMLADAYKSGNVPDIKIVPISISYDRILEEHLFAYELIGIPKPKESTAGLIKGLRVMSGNYGKVFINFGKPLSIRDFSQDVEDCRILPNETEIIKIKEIAYKIIEQQQNLQTFTIFNLLALILYKTYIRTGSHRVTLANSVEQIKWLHMLYKQFGATVNIAGNIENSIRESIKVHGSLIQLSSENDISLKLEEKCVNSNPSGNISTMEYLISSVPYVMLQIYVNPSLSLFIRASLVVVILHKISDQQKIKKDILLDNYRYLCNILKHEFVLDGNIKDFNDCLQQLHQLQVIKYQSDLVLLLPCSDTTKLFIELLHPFVTGVYVICEFLLNEQLDNQNQRDIKKIVQSHIEEKVRDGVISYHYCSTFDFISNTLSSLLEVGIISKNDERDSIFINIKSLKFATEYIGNLAKGMGFQSEKNLRKMSKNNNDFKAKL